MNNNHQSDFRENLKTRHKISKWFYFILLACLLVGLLMLTALIVDLAVEGHAWLRPELFTNYHSRKPEQAGMKSAIVGSLIVMSLTGLVQFSSRYWCSDLPGRVRQEKLADQFHQY